MRRIERLAERLFTALSALTCVRQIDSVGRLLYLYLENAKRQLRGLPTKIPLAQSRAELLGAIEALAVGADLAAFVHEATAARSIARV